MAEEKQQPFQDIDHLNKTEYKPAPSKINDIATENELIDNIIMDLEQGTFDMNTINAFTNISRSRDSVYNLIDTMSEDPIISSALEIYTSDICEPNDKGEIVWCESNDTRAFSAVKSILNNLDINKNIYGWAYSLIKYGDLYLRLYRNSEYNKLPELIKKNKKERKEKKNLSEDLDTSLDGIPYNVLNEDVIIKAFKSDDHYAEYMEMIKNPAEVYNLMFLGKSYGFLRTHLPQTMNIARKNSTIMGSFDSASNIFNMRYQFDEGDVDVYDATEFVHACLEDHSSRTTEEIALTNTQDDTTIYNVKRGQSILYNVFKVWRELALLENSVLLNRLTKSSILRLLSIEVGDMDEKEARNILARFKMMVEQKTALNVGNNISEYTNPGPVENTIYTTTHDGKGGVTAQDLGGDASVKPQDLADLNYWKNKEFAALGIPGAYLGDSSDDSAMFNNGSSLAQKSSKYAKRIKLYQTALINMITDAVNMILLDKGQVDYINNFAIKMQAPTTQEELDRKANESNAINNISQIQALFPDVSPKAKLEMTKSLLSNVISNSEVLDIIQEEIDKLNAADEEVMVGAEGGDEFGGGGMGGGFDLGGGGSTFGGKEMSAEGEPESGEFAAEEPAADAGEFAGGELPTPDEAGSPSEDFTTGEGELFLKEKELPTFSDLGVSYTDVR